MEHACLGSVSVNKKFEVSLYFLFLITPIPQKAQLKPKKRPQNPSTTHNHTQEKQTKKTNQKINFFKKPETSEIYPG